MKHIVPWLTLKSVPGVGNLLITRLIDIFKTPENVLSASTKALVQVEGITPRIANAIQRQRTPDWVMGEIEQVHKRGFAFVTRHDSLYPRLLREIPDPPPLLYVYGSLADIRYPISVVGSRKATTYGRKAARSVCRQLAGNGASIVSGMASGIDTAAHEGALEGGGQTVAVLGSGLNNIYPAQNRYLFHRIAKQGAVITEFNMNARPDAHHFPMRNRIISGISLGTVVVEAARKSGSLITARLAAEQNREVFAVPGNIHCATARGTHDLIKQGAKLVETADDIIEEIAPQLAGTEPVPAGSKKPPELSIEEQRAFEAIDAYPVHIDDLARQLGQPAGPLAGILARLELKGVVCQEPGKFFVRHTDYSNTHIP